MDEQKTNAEKTIASETLEKDWWLEAAQEAFSQSTTFMDNNLRRRIENNYRHFQNRHHSGSKYYKSAYKYRSKHFRPKTRSSIRQHEAAAVAALFSNREVVNIEAQNPVDDFQKASSEINKELLQFRLTVTNPWFLICIGAYQEAMVTGVIVSHQSWEYEEIETEETYGLYDADTDQPIIDGNTGKPATETKKYTKIIKDRPNIELIPFENIRIHPNSNWTDPINSSPYLIHMIPMYVMDIKARMQTGNAKTGQPKWKSLSDDQIAAAKGNAYDSTRQTRENDRTDKTDVENTPALGNFDIIWIHRNFIRVDGVDYVYYTLGTEFRLTDPVPGSDIYFEFERPYTMGISVVEAHKIYPSGLGQLGENVQNEINDWANQKMDTGKFVLNKRWFVKRGSQVDVKSITRNAPGSVTFVNDINHDVKAQDFNDLAGSSFAIEDRLNVDYDEIVGNFSSSTIQTNRKLNETVGGMNMLRGTVNALTEYNLRTFSETWAEPTLRQIIMLEQKYETDEVVLALAANKAQLWQKYGIDQITDNLLNQKLTTTVNIGMGATDPIMKLRNLAIGLDTIINLLQVQEGPFNIIEIANEVFGLLGYKDGTRFLVDQLNGQDPEKMQMMALIQQLQAIIQDLQSQIDTKQLDNETKLKLAQIKEIGEDRRTAAQLKTNMAMKRLDLLNPVVGENKRIANA